MIYCQQIYSNSQLFLKDGKERQDLPPTPPSSESNPEVATAQPDTSGDETSSRGTLDSIIPPPADFEGRNNPFLGGLAPIPRPVKRRLSEKDIIITSTGEVEIYFNNDSFYYRIKE